MNIDCMMWSKLTGEMYYFISLYRFHYTCPPSSKGCSDNKTPQVTINHGKSIKFGKWWCITHCGQSGQVLSKTHLNFESMIFNWLPVWAKEMLTDVWRIGKKSVVQFPVIANSQIQINGQPGNCFTCTLGHSGHHQAKTWGSSRWIW